MTILVSPSRRRTLAAGLAAALGSLGAPPGARGQSVNVRRLVVGFPAGGLADRLGRIVAEALGQESPAGFVVDNRPGAGGMVATEQVARSEGDGKLALLHNVDILAQERVLRNDPAFDPLRSLAIVAPVARYEYFMVATAKLGLRNLQDLIALARATPTSLFYVDAGPGVRLIFENLKKKFGLNLVGVPYRGLAPAMTDLLAGRVELAMLDGATAPVHSAAGKVTVLGRGDALRSGSPSSVPTLDEQGAEGLWVDTRYALMLPASAPPAIVEPLRALATGVLKSPSVRAQLAQAAYHPIDETPEQFLRSVAASVAHYRRLAQQAGMI
ncbi:MAG: tripartite tricarboxylate transporter substrate binding protein [Burkholderiales bacterium]|nr:tripartite tricarboxylate transporter substrate binding protein [Burkholderiales bacterium]